MTIKLSKTQWEAIGKQANWTKKAQLVAPTGGPQPATQNQIGMQPQQAQQQQPQGGQQLKSMRIVDQAIKTIEMQMNNSLRPDVRGKANQLLTPLKTLFSDTNAWS